MSPLHLQIFTVFFFFNIEPRFLLCFFSCRYDGSIGSASRAMAAADHFASQLGRKNL